MTTFLLSVLLLVAMLLSVNRYLHWRTLRRRRRLWNDAALLRLYRDLLALRPRRVTDGTLETIQATTDTDAITHLIGETRP